MRMIGYCRVSTDQQEQNGYGLDAQEAKIREACAQKGWELVELVRESGSGKDLGREKLQEALSRLARGEAEAEGLVVAKLDRLSRSLIDFSILLDWFRGGNLALVALDFDLDTSTPGGKLVASIVAATAEWEREMIGVRTRDALAAMKAQGLPTGPPCLTAETRELIQRLRGEGLTMRQIADRLNLERIPTARGGRWSPSTVHGALGARRTPRRRATELPKIRRTR